MSPSSILFYYIFVTSIFFCGSNDTERLALLEIKAKISHDPLGVMNSWNDSLQFCDWYGVTCARLNEGVTTLDLSSRNLTGTLSSHIGNLSFLEILRLNYNNFVGKIPDSLGKLKNLTTLYLEKNMFEGAVPPSIFNLSLLTNFSLMGNDLHGDLPSELGNTLPRLTFLSLGDNRFTGRIPPSISNSSNLESLQLHNNNLQGQVPSLYNLVNLAHLVLSNNSLGYNKIGDLDFVSSLSNATSLQSLAIDQNNFKGVLPQMICNFPMLTYLYISQNNIVGEIPTCIENLHKIGIFSAYDNSLSGTLPQNIGKLQDLYILELSNNQLSGFIPHSIGNLTKLSTFSLTNNKFEGQIPSSLGKCTSLTNLYLGNNSLNGAIPSQLFTLQTLSSLNIIDLSRNHLTGHIPEEIGRLMNMRMFLVHYNKLSGKIPNSLSSCIALEFLYLSKNEFHGTIPNGLRSLKGLFELDLSYNNLVGEIPPFLASLKLVLLNVSHNNFEGKVPIDGVFSNITRTILGGNSRLCGGIPELNLPHCNNSGHNAKKKKVLIVSILSCVFGVVIFLVIVLLLSRTLCRRKNTNNNETISFGHLEKFPNLSYQVLFRASKGFSSENLVGSGTYGLVYQGKLNKDGPEIAIKAFKLEYHGALRSFMVECSILRSIRHRNLVKVITSCSSVDNQGRDFKALVYEYMVNGSLEHWLHPKIINDVESINNTSKNLNFYQRLDIAIDVAIALEYLHHECSVPIIHCDIKPSNVLLDHKMVAHVSDFGISKILLEGINNDNHGNQSSSSIGIRGTIGYTPPEYGLGKCVSTSGDVYSFGIVLLEIFTGKRPTNDFFQGDKNLHDFVSKALPQSITTILDHAILQDINKEGIQRNMILLEASTHILRVALSCSAEIPNERLNMNDVVTELLSIRNKLINKK